MNTLTTAETEAILTLCLLAFFADGEKREREREREQLRKITASFAGAEVDVAALYQQVLMNRPAVAEIAARLLTSGVQQLAYEMAVCVCDADDVCNAAEQRFL